MDHLNKPPITEYLAHYSSPYYDPEKAHDYYMRNRELKGKRSTSKLSDEGKKIWSSTKEQIKTEKKAKVEGEREKQNQTIAEQQAKARATRERISAKLKALKGSLFNRKADIESATAERERVAKELKMVITATREAYKAAKTELDTSYEDVYQREFEKIAAEMPKVSKRKSSKKT